jgi:hypothetical protein
MNRVGGSSWTTLMLRSSLHIQPTKSMNAYLSRDVRRLRGNDPGLTYQRSPGGSHQALLWLENFRS